MVLIRFFSRFQDQVRHVCVLYLFAQANREETTETTFFFFLIWKTVFSMGGDGSRKG